MEQHRYHCLSAMYSGRTSPSDFEPVTPLGSTWAAHPAAAGSSLNFVICKANKDVASVRRRSVAEGNWCQRRDSNSQTPVSKTGCYSNSHTLALWCTGEDLNLRVPLGETGLQPVRFGRAHAPVQTWRKVDESNAHRSSRCPGFQDQLPAIQQYLPHGGEYGS